MPAILCRHGIDANESIVREGRMARGRVAGRCRFCAEGGDDFARPGARAAVARATLVRNALRRGSIDAVYAAFVGPEPRCDCGADVDGGPHIWPCESY